MRTIVAATIAVLSLAAQDAPVIDDATRAGMANRVSGGHTVGVMVGLATPEGRVFASRGATAKAGPEPTKDTVFEIGSITKVFTALLLADMVERGEVDLDDPVAKYLPGTVTVPSRNGRPITLADLVTHTSGLPRLPSNLNASDLDNPYAGYDAAQLYAFLSGYELTRNPGSEWEYSNLGVGLLGHVLALHAGTSYARLVQQRILDPLHMTSTTIALIADERSRLATGHDGGLDPVGLWDFGVLAGAGALRSTASDLLTFAAANAGLIDTPLAPAMARMRRFRRPGPQPGTEQAMGWLVIAPFGSELFVHEGGTHGFRSAIVVDPARMRASVAWANAPLPVMDLAAHVVEPRAPVPMLDSARAVVHLDAETLADYVGTYELTPTFSIEITREGERLFEQATDQARIEIFPSHEDEFFLRAVNAEISFVRDAAGKVVALVLHQGGRDRRAPKVK